MTVRKKSAKNSIYQANPIVQDVSEIPAQFKLTDQKRNEYLECAVNAVQEAARCINQTLGGPSKPFEATSGHEKTYLSDKAQGELNRAFDTEQSQHDIQPNEKIRIIKEEEDLYERVNKLIKDVGHRNKLCFLTVDCPDGSTKLHNFSEARHAGIPTLEKPAAAINMTLYEGGTTFEHITANINFSMAGDLVIARKNKSNVVDIMFENTSEKDPERISHPTLINVKQARKAYSIHSGTLYAQIMTNDNFECDEAASQIKKALRIVGINRIRFESSGSSIYDQHRAIYLNGAHILVDPRGLSPEGGPVLHPGEAASHFLEFKEFGWEMSFMEPRSGIWYDLSKFDLTNPDYRAKDANGDPQYKMIVAFYSPNLNHKDKCMDAVSSAMQPYLIDKM